MLQLQYLFHIVEELEYAAALDRVVVGPLPGREVVRECRSECTPIWCNGVAIVVHIIHLN